MECPFGGGTRVRLVKFVIFALVLPVRVNCQTSRNRLSIRPVRINANRRGEIGGVPAQKSLSQPVKAWGIRKDDRILNSLADNLQVSASWFAY